MCGYILVGIKNKLGRNRFIASISRTECSLSGDVHVLRITRVATCFIFLLFFFLAMLNFHALFLKRWEIEERVRERNSGGWVRASFFFLLRNAKKTFLFVLKKNQKYVPIKRALFARYESLTRRKNGWKRTNALFFSPRARVLLYFYCFDGSAAREYACLFFAKWVGKKKRKSSALMKNESLATKLNQNLVRGVEEKKRRAKSKIFLLFFSFFFFEWVSLATKTSFFSSLSSWFFARAGTSSQIFCRITQTRPKLLVIASGICTRALWQNIILTNPR